MAPGRTSDWDVETVSPVALRMLFTARTMLSLSPQQGPGLAGRISLCINRQLDLNVLIIIISVLRDEGLKNVDGIFVLI